MVVNAHESSPEEDAKLIELGECSRKLGTDKMFHELLNQITVAQHQIIAQSAVENISVREAAYHMIRAIEQIRTQISIIQTRGDRAKARTIKKATK